MVSDKLAAFLAEASTKTYRLGEFDCGLWLADWYMAATGRPDPASDYRGLQYVNGPGPRTYVVRRIAQQEGLERTSTPECGDVGLVSLSKGHLVGGIFTGTHWCVLSNDGERTAIDAIIPDRIRVIAAWAID